MATAVLQPSEENGEQQQQQQQEQQTNKKHQKRPKSTFMLHSKHPYECLGKYVSSDYRYAALKAASRGIEEIYLRKTNSKIFYVYSGKVVTLDKPQIVKRGEREIMYTKKPTVTFLRKFVYTGDAGDIICEGEGETETPSSVDDDGTGVGVES
jgi:hypothetical protein